MKKGLRQKETVSVHCCVKISLHNNSGGFCHISQQARFKYVQFWVHQAENYCLRLWLHILFLVKKWWYIRSAPREKTVR